MADKKDIPRVQPTISMPSADLIAYRFDQLDKVNVEINRKLDAIFDQNSKFPTEARAQQMIDEAVKPVQKQIDNYQWYWRALVLGFISLVVYLVVAKVGK